MGTTCVCVCVCVCVSTTCVCLTTSGDVAFITGQMSITDPDIGPSAGVPHLATAHATLGK